MYLSTDCFIKNFVWSGTLDSKRNWVSASLSLHVSSEMHDLCIVQLDRVNIITYGKLSGVFGLKLKIWYFSLRFVDKWEEGFLWTPIYYMYLFLG